MFVLQRHGDGQFVTPSGSEKSYTKDLTKARIYLTRDSAAKNKCGNESVVPVEDLLNKPE